MWKKERIITIISQKVNLNVTVSLITDGRLKMDFEM